MNIADAALSEPHCEERLDHAQKRLAPCWASRSQTSRLGESRTSSLLGLKAAPRTATRLPANVPPTAFAGHVGNLCPTIKVDSIDGGKQACYRVQAEPGRGGMERADIFRQASSAETEARGKERRPIRLS